MAVMPRMPSLANAIFTASIFAGRTTASIICMVNSYTLSLVRAGDYTGSSESPLAILATINIPGEFDDRIGRPTRDASFLCVPEPLQSH
jgi:hypothetical protein